MNKKALIVGYATAPLSHETSCRNQFRTRCDSSWTTHIARIGSSESSSEIHIRPATITDAYEYAVTEGYDIVTRSYSGFYATLYDYALENGVMCFETNGGNTFERSTEVPGITSAIAVSAGNDTQTTTAYGPGTELFDTYGSNSEQSYSMPLAAGSYSRLLDAGLNIYDARQALREYCSEYPSWTERDGYGRPVGLDTTIGPIDPFDLDLMAPFNLLVTPDSSTGLVRLSWTNATTTRWFKTTIKDELGNVIYSGTDTSCVWRPDEPGEWVVYFYSEDVYGNLSDPVEHATRVVTTGTHTEVNPFQGDNGEVWDSSLWEYTGAGLVVENGSGVMTPSGVLEVRYRKNYSDFDLMMEVERTGPSLFFSLSLYNQQTNSHAYQFGFYPSGHGAQSFLLISGQSPDQIEGGFLDHFYLRVQSIGGVLRFKHWEFADDEPDTWQFDNIEDVPRLYNPHLRAQYSGGSSGDVRIHQFSITPLTPEWEDVALVTEPGLVNQYIDEGLEPGGIYEYELVLLRGDEETDPVLSNVVTVHQQEASAALVRALASDSSKVGTHISRPEPPTSFKMVASTYNQVDLSWTKSPRATGYRIRRLRVG